MLGIPETDGYEEGLLDSDGLNDVLGLLEGALHGLSQSSPLRAQTVVVTQHATLLTRVNTGGRLGFSQPPAAGLATKLTIPTCIKGSCGPPPGLPKTSGPPEGVML